MDELTEALSEFINDIYETLNPTKREIEPFNIISNPDIREKNQIYPKNFLLHNLNRFKKLTIDITEGINFPYKMRGKRNTLVSIKVHPDLPNFLTKVSQNHTKHAKYNAHFDIDISNYDLTNIIPVVFIFDKLQDGNFELLGLNYIEFQNPELKDDKLFIYNDKWLNIFTKETRTYSGSIKITMFFSDIKQEKQNAHPYQITNDIYDFVVPNSEEVNKKRERTIPESVITKNDIGIQTDEYEEEILPAEFENENNECNYSVIHDKGNKFVFISDGEINDEMIVEYNFLDTNKLIFQNETDQNIIDKLSLSIDFSVNSEENPFNFKVYDRDNIENIINTEKPEEEIKIDYEIRHQEYNPEKYVTYNSFDWDKELKKLFSQNISF